MSVLQHVLKMGIVGGGQGAFIGRVHRTAACLDGGAACIAGCLSSAPDRARASGKEWGFADDRNYSTWADMLARELKRPASERIDFVTIVTPNHMHFPIAKAFAEAGINVVCDKPMVTTVDEARELERIVKRTGAVFAVTYNYSGYPLVKQARAMVGAGEIGAVRKVIVEYNQGWLAGKLEATGQKQAEWRTDPARSGVGGAIGDIGSHAEQLCHYITGLRIEALCADLSSFVPGRRLDDDANVLIRFAPAGGIAAKGVLIASQIEIGHENDLRIRVFGERATLEWRQEEPNALVVRKDGAPEQVYRRGNGYLNESAARASRLPPGHPEAFFEAFANVYSGAGAAIRARQSGGAALGGIGLAGRFDYPDVADGARGVEFIHRVVESAGSDRKWLVVDDLR